MKQLCLLLLCASIPLVAIGCFEEEDSCNIRTPGIFVEYSVTEHTNSAKAEVIFWTGDSPGGTYLKLGGCGDAISVNGTPLEKTGSNPITYKSSVDLATTYVVQFERPDEGAYNSTIDAMPPKVQIQTPSGQNIPRDEPFDITWENDSAGQINLLISSDCFSDYPTLFGNKVEDNGLYTVNADELEVVSSEAGNECAASVKLTRTIDGTLNENLKGTIVGKTMDTGVFTSTPGAEEFSYDSNNDDDDEQ